MAGKPSAALRRGLRSDRTHPWRHENLGRLLLLSVINWQDVLVQELRRRGFPSFRASHMNLLRHVDLEGTRIGEIAQRARITKQAVGELIAGCEAERLVKVEPDRTDGRAKIVRFTPLGRKIIDAEKAIMEDMDARLGRSLGSVRLAALRETLTLLAQGTSPYVSSPRPRARRPSRRQAAPGR